MKDPRCTVPVLMYHHVTPAGGMINVSPENFEAQLAWLKAKGYQSLTTDQFAAHLNGDAAPRHSVLLTFDDGYLDNWLFAYPLLKKYGLKATVFLVTSWNQQGPVRTQKTAPTLFTHHECEQRIDTGHSDDVIMRWSEIQAAREEGTFEFHSHTHTHTRWDLGPQSEQKNSHIRQELQGSRATLQQQLGQVSEHFCWPQGYFDPDYVRIAREEGFRYLYTTRAFGQNRPGTDPGHIYRFAVRNTSGQSVGRRIQVAEHPVIGPVFNGWKRWKRSLRGQA